MYVPAFQAKDLAVELEAHENVLSSEQRCVVEPALQRLVRYPHMLDAFGDLGNREQISRVYEQFAAAAHAVAQAFPN